MTLALAPSGILYRVGVKVFVAKAKDVLKKNKWWMEPASWGVGTILFVMGAVAGAIGMHEVYTKQIPELKQDLKEGFAGVHKLLKATEVAQRTELNSHIAKEETSRAKMDGSIKVLQTHLIAMIQKVEKRNLKPEEMRTIISSVSEISKSEASQLNAPNVSGEAPKMPAAMATFGTKFGSLFENAFGHVPYKGPYISAEKFLARALVAKDVKWQVEDRGLVVSYDGGSAVFPARESASRMELEHQATLFNSMSQAIALLLESGGVEGVPYKPRPEAPNRWKANPTIVVPDTRAPVIPGAR